MSVYIGYCFYLCGETAQAAGDVAERASETARLFGLECIGGTQQLCSLFLCVEIRFGAFHVVADQCRIVQDAVKLIESGADRALIGDDWETRVDSDADAKKRQRQITAAFKQIAAQLGAVKPTLLPQSKREEFISEIMNITVGDDGNILIMPF